MGTERQAARAPDLTAPDARHRSMNEPRRAGIEQDRRQPLPGDPGADGRQKPGITLADAAAAPDQPIDQADYAEQQITQQGAGGGLADGGRVPGERQEQSEEAQGSDRALGMMKWR